MEEANRAMIERFYNEMWDERDFAVADARWVVGDTQELWKQLGRP